jgi:hypothetical protein
MNQQTKNETVKRILGLHDENAAKHIEQLLFYCFLKVKESKLSLKDFQSIAQHCEELLELIHQKIDEKEKNAHKSKTL